jgi:hypothetical protein
VLDKSKLPTDLIVHRVWVPDDDSGSRRSIAYVGERRRRIVGAVLIAVGVILMLSVLVTRAAFWLAFVPLLIAWGGVAYGGGGRTGFYELSDDGGLGDYLGRSKPEIRSMRQRKP